MARRYSAYEEQLMQLIDSCCDRLKQQPDDRKVQEELLSRRRELDDLQRKRDDLRLQGLISIVVSATDWIGLPKQLKVHPKTFYCSACGGVYDTEDCAFNACQVPTDKDPQWKATASTSLTATMPTAATAHQPEGD